MQMNDPKTWLLVRNDTQLNNSIVVKIPDRESASILQKVDAGNQCHIVEISLAIQEHAISFVATE